MTPADTITTYRPTLFLIIYRVTGEVMVGEKIVQEMILKWISRSPK
ncbi:hypothetical protein [Spirosoma jeollabukense]